MSKLLALVLAFIRADQIREPMMAIENIKQKDLNSISMLQSIGITVDVYEPSIKEEELDIYYDSIKKSWRQEFCDAIHFYGAEDELYRQSMKEIPQNPKYSKYFKVQIVTYSAHIWSQRLSNRQSIILKR